MKDWEIIIQQINDAFAEVARILAEYIQAVMDAIMPVVRQVKAGAAAHDMTLEAYLERGYFDEQN